MDTFIINSKLIRAVLSKILNRVVKKNLGVVAVTKLNEFIVSVHDGQAHVGINIEADMTEEELGKLIAKIGL